MKKILLYLVVAVLLLPVSYAYGFSTQGQDCAKCHTLTKDDAATLLKDIDPNLKVLDVRMVPVKGMWEVDIESGGKKVPLYVDFSKKYLISGAIVNIKDKKNLTKERAEELNALSRNDVSNIPLGDAVVMGDRKAKYKVIVFDDPE